MCRRTLGCTVFLFLVVFACGCSGEVGPPRGAVSGRVTIDGKALEEGTINFIPTKGTKGPTAGGPVNGGEYSIARDQGPVVGLNRVEIRGSRKTGKQIPDVRVPGTKIEEMVELVPARYNTNSTLEKEVKAGKNTLDFELTSK